MGALDALTGGGDYRPAPGTLAGVQLVEAVVATTAASATEEVYVLISQEASQLRVGPCRWMPRASASGPVFPSRGDSAAVMMSDRGHRHIVWWEPVS